MSKLFTLLLCLLGMASGWSQNCTVYGTDYAGNFISCANNPSTTTIFFGPPPHPSGYGTLAITGSSPAVDLSGLTIHVPDKVRLVFTGAITFDANTKFEGSGGNAEVQFGTNGQVYKANRGRNSFVFLNSLVVSCASNPNPMNCMETGIILPVELTRFVAQSKKDQVELDWTTASELNNDYFQIEHSRDGLQFFSVGKVKGEGTTTETMNYQFMHRQPVAGTNYYRLKQVDFDGAFEYSDVVVAELGTRAGGIQIYPNPTIDKAVIRIPERPERVQFRLSNLLGQRIDLQPVPTDGGWEIDLGHLPRGIYVLGVEYRGKLLSKRIVRE